MAQRCSELAFHVPGHCRLRAHIVENSASALAETENGLPSSSASKATPGQTQPEAGNPMFYLP
jgi:hypothetical protein